MFPTISVRATRGFLNHVLPTKDRTFPCSPQTLPCSPQSLNPWRFGISPGKILRFMGNLPLRKQIAPGLSQDVFISEKARSMKFIRSSTQNRCTLVAESERHGGETNHPNLKSSTRFQTFKLSSWLWEIKANRRKAEEWEGRERLLP